MSKFENRLIHETSPYLLQHAHNPVNWYAWGDEAFESAKSADKLVLLSVGYSACHWCHVMERESFEDPDIAALMNELYVCIKVDREERPDVDHIYMQVVQAMTGQGGWPMTVIMTAAGVPIFGGTYFPPTDQRGMLGFVRVLKAVEQTWREQPDEIESGGSNLLERLNQAALAKSGAQARAELLTEAAEQVSGTFDERYGGTDRAPKFPQPMTWEAVLRAFRRTGNFRYAEMVRKTLTRMARGGMYDQLGGGFHRYSVDGRWMVPHFEKMLYDNAQLARLYTDAFTAFGDSEYRQIAEETLDYIQREMTDPKGGFYSAQDADSEGEEGRFFVWTRAEFEEVINDDAVSRAASTYWSLDERPNFDGQYILNVPRPADEVASQLHLSQPELRAMLETARRRLFEQREQRVKPGLDDKVLTSWNGLAARAFAEAGAVFGRPDYVETARANASFILGTMRRDDGRLLRTWRQKTSPILGFLDDYANTIDALLALHAATLEPKWLDAAQDLADAMLALFWDDERALLFDTGSDHEQLITRPRDSFDNAAPAGNSVAAEVLLKLGIISGRSHYRDRAASILDANAHLMARFPSGAGRLLCALDLKTGPVAEIAIVLPDDATSDTASEILSALRTRYLPNRVVVAGRQKTATSTKRPLLRDRGTVDGKLTVYVCENYACQLPVTTAEAFEDQLERLAPAWMRD